MSEYPKVTELEGTFRVEYGTIGTSNDIHRAHEATLRDLLNKRHEERMAKRWVAIAHSARINHWWRVCRSGEQATTWAATFEGATFDHDRQADAEEYAAKLNAREGLS